MGVSNLRENIAFLALARAAGRRRDQMWAEKIFPDRKGQPAS